MPAHDPALYLCFDWTPVAVALIAAVASCLNTLGLAWIYLRVHPPSGGHPGRMIEDAAQTAHANNALLTAIAREHGIGVPEREG